MIASDDAEAGERPAELGKPIDSYSAILSASSATPRFVSEITFGKRSNHLFRSMDYSQSAFGSVHFCLRTCRMIKV